MRLGELRELHVADEHTLTLSLPLSASMLPSRDRFGGPLKAPVCVAYTAAPA